MSGHVMAHPVEIGERFAERYVVSHIAGSGGMSVVVGARHDHLCQLMAVKFLSVRAELGREAVQRFFKEARAAASLRSEHIVRVTDAGTDENGRHFIAMEYLDGSDLAHLLRKNGPLAIADAVGYVLHACEGIAEAHAAGIVHRDLKPANLFVTKRIDGTPLVKVLDFGVSKISNTSLLVGDDSLSHPNSVLGTPTYMAPEQLRRPDEVDARTDVWALGLILLELLTGMNPFTAATAPEIFAAVLADTDPPSASELRADLPAGLADVIARCLRKDPALRTCSAGALAAELLAWTPPWAREAGDRAARLCHSTPPPSPTTDSKPASPVVPERASRNTRLHNALRSSRGRVVLGFAAVGLVAIALVLRASWASRSAHSAAYSDRGVPAPLASSSSVTGATPPSHVVAKPESGPDPTGSSKVEAGGGDPLPRPIIPEGGSAQARTSHAARHALGNSGRASREPSVSKRRAQPAASDPLDGRQ